MKHFILTVLIGTFLSLGSFAQNGKIKGVITDKSDNSFVRGATVTLLLQKDSSLVKSTLTDTQGSFEFINLPTDRFIVTASNIGYQQYFSFISINEDERDLGTIGLTK